MFQVTGRAEAKALRGSVPDDSGPGKSKAENSVR